MQAEIFPRAKFFPARRALLRSEHGRAVVQAHARARLTRAFTISLRQEPPAMPSSLSSPPLTPPAATHLSRVGALAVCFAALAGGLAVALGAWASHGTVEPAKSWLATAAQYQVVHALALLAAVLLRERLAGAARHLAGTALVAFVLGIVLFCGALVALSVGHSWGVAAPAGGLLLMAGWLALAIAGAICALRAVARVA
jgi:uncharacterized membrane protein YgdD (TMEM256/DUF423 family)